MTLKHACHVMADTVIKSIPIGRLPTFYGGRLLWPERSTWHSIYWSYEPYMAQAMKDHLSVGSTFWDVGAHVGWFSLFASSLVGTTGSVEAFEPSPQVFHALSLNVARRRNVRVHNVGVGETDELRSFSSRGLSSAASFVEDVTRIDEIYFPGGEAISKASVSITRLDTFLESSPAPALVKIDVEGYELRTLRGAPKLLRDRKPAIILEVHPPQLKLSGGSEREIYDLLQENRYLWKMLYRNENSIYTLLAV